MAAVQKKNQAITSKTQSRRRRKKRRTEDFSSDSDSDSSSSSSGDESTNEKETTDAQTLGLKADINIDKIDINSDNEIDVNSNSLDDPIKEDLQKVKLTKTSLNLHSKANVNSHELDKELDAKRKELNSQYLLLMAKSYDNDLDELRKAPDFNTNSLVILAKALQSGGNIFDKDSLASILDK